MMKTKQKQLFEASQGGPSAKTPVSDIIAIGTVVDTNDPMQWGRIRAVVPVWGDSVHDTVESMPWCMYVTPFGGQTSTGTRGSGLEQTEGGVAYGMWAIPNLGAQVVIMSLDEEHQQRLFMGCVYDVFTTHTLPHGRWTYEDHPALEGQKPPAKPYGPFSSEDKLIQPLAKNIAQAFGSDTTNLEKQSRIGDYSVSRVDVSHIPYSKSKVQDDDEVVNDTEWSHTTGYQASRVAPDNPSSITKKNYDSQVYSLTSPGFHSISMDDRMENCRVRIRTTSGHQILMDDTNERIYIATAQGNNWVEMDQAGNIDVYSSNKVSIKAAKDINLTSDKTIRMFAKEGIHMYSEKEIRTHAKEDIHVDTKKAIKIKASKDINITSGADLKLTTKSTTHINSGVSILMTAADIYQNGPTAKRADKSELAFYTNRTPAHEPWARASTKKDTGHEPEFNYTDNNIGRVDQGETIPRGIYWRR